MKYKYCSKCGSALIVKPEHVQYDWETGNKIYKLYVICPNAKTGFLGMLFDEHTNKQIGEHLGCLFSELELYEQYGVVVEGE